MIMTGTLSQGLRAGRWDLVNSLSSAGFSVRNFGVRTVVGQIPILQAWVDVDDAGRAHGAYAVLDLAGIDTGHARRDHDLRKPHLLGIEKFPRMTFTGGPAEPSAEGWQMPGRLEAHGTDVAVVLTVEAEHNSRGDVSVQATTSIDRRDLRVTAPRFVIGRDVAVTIDACFRGPS